MTSFLFSFTVLITFIFSFIHLAEYGKDQLFIKQAGLFALRSHYLNQDYLNTLQQYSHKTCQKPYTFESTLLTENHSITELKIKTKHQESLFNDKQSYSDLKKTTIDNYLFYLGKKQ
ncbi:hypothetical protein MRY82_08885 [bacterium]|nr:hypothetical protein [bacterium]